ncbi:TPA: hypothetical protein ACRMWJ_005763 [Pseudomonas aeruginosa]
MSEETKVFALTVAVFCGVGLVGCSTSVVSSNPRNVVVESQSLNAAEAQKLADAECRKHNRYAKMTIKGDYWDRNYTFECAE